MSSDSNGTFYDCIEELKEDVVEQELETLLRVLAHRLQAEDKYEAVKRLLSSIHPHRTQNLRHNPVRLSTRFRNQLSANPTQSMSPINKSSATKNSSRLK